MAPRGLMLPLGVEFGAAQHMYDRGNPHFLKPITPAPTTRRSRSELPELDAYQENSAQIQSHRMAATGRIR